MFRRLFPRGPTPKPIPISTPSSNQSSLSSTPSNNVALIPPTFESWRCQQCTYVNQPSMKQCEMCGGAYFDTKKTTVPPAQLNVSRTTLASPAKASVQQKIDAGAESIPLQPVPKQSLPSPEKLYSVTNRGAAATVYNVSNPNEHATVHTIVYFPNGEAVERSITCPVHEVEQRLAGLTLATPNNTPQKEAQSKTGVNPNRNAVEPSAPAKQEHAKYDPTGGFVDAPDVFKESLANAGFAGGEREQSNPLDGQFAIDNSRLTKANTRQSRRASVGPQQKGIIDKIDTRERKFDKLQDTGGSRVNQLSSNREYDLGGYEEAVYIDAQRHQRPAVAEESDELKENSVSTSNLGVPVEIAAVGAKIRNIHRVTGERVKEMDHFVAEVQTPVVKIAMSDETASNGTKMVTKNDIGAYLQASYKRTGMDRSVMVRVDPAVIAYGGCQPHRALDVLVEHQYCNGSNTPTAAGALSASCPDHILRYAAIMYWICEVLFEILGLELSEQSVQLYYMTTVRADEFVCSLAAAPDDRLYINVMVLQQAQQCDLQEGDSLRPIGIQGEKIKEVFSSWLVRIISAIFHKGRDPAILPRRWTYSTINPTQYSKQKCELAAGLYDAVIRARFYEKVLQLQESATRLQGLSAAMTPFDEGLAKMSILNAKYGQIGSTPELERRRLEELFSRAIAEARERQDAVGEKLAIERLLMVQSHQNSNSSLSMPRLTNFDSNQRLNAFSQHPPKDSHSYPPQLPASRTVSASEAPDDEVDPESLQYLIDCFAGGSWSVAELKRVLLQHHGNTEAAVNFLLS